MPDLVHLLSDKQLDANVRELIIECLGKFGERSVVPDLMRLLTNDTLDEEVTISFISGAGDWHIVVMPMGMHVGIANALGNLGERSVVPELMHLLTNDKLDANVRASIALALGKLGERSVVPELMRSLSDASVVQSEFYWLMAMEIGDLGERSVAPELVHLLTNEALVVEKSDVSVRRNIARALGNLGECSVVPELVRLLSDEKLDANVRVEIAEAIGELGERTVVSELIHLLSNENSLDADVRRAITRIVGVLAEDEVTTYTLAKYLKTSHMADHIYNALWNVSRRAGVRIFTVKGSDGNEEVEVIKW